MQTANFQDEAYDALKTMILTLKLMPGQRVDKKDLEQQLGIGATPIREAILRLRREGLFNVLPQSGTFVSKINLDQLYQGRFVRMTIEKVVVAEAADALTTVQHAQLDQMLQMEAIILKSHDYAQFFQYDEQFHEFFYNAARKHFVWEWLLTLNLQFDRYRYLRLSMQSLDWNLIYKQHQEIAAAAKKKDHAVIEKLVTEHLHMVDDDVQVVRDAYPDYFTESR